MGLIIGRKLPQLKKGYPTVSDKYDVEGAIAASDIIDGSAIVIDSVNANTYAMAAAETKKIAGFALASNVKLDRTQWPAGETIKTVAGETFNLMTKGFIAVEVNPETIANIKNGAMVKLTASGFEPTAVATEAIEGLKFTGLTEVKASTVERETGVVTPTVVLAEVRFHI